MSSYRRHYDDYFLDGLHNYLPEVLYGPPAQFDGAAPLVAYIQSQVRSQFDLFSAGQRSFTPTMSFSSRSPFRTPTREPSFMRPPPPVQRQNVVHEEIHYNAQISPSIQSMINGILGGNATTYLTPQGNTNALLAGLLGIAPPQNFMDPVIVHPTAEQIEAGTTLEIVDAQDEMCAICQDSMMAGSEARALNACDHRFHPGCIDTWFQRDVRCPTCRHDVREPAAE